MQAAAGIFLRDGNDQTQIGFRQLIFGALVALGDAACKLLLLLSGEQGNLTDLLEVHSHGVIQIIFGGQLYGVDQRFLFFQLGIGNVDVVIQQVGYIAAFGFGTDDLNADGFKGVVDLFDFFDGKVEFFQCRKQFRR